MADQSIKVTDKDWENWFGEYDASLIELSLRAFCAVLSRKFGAYGIENKVFFEFTPNLRDRMRLRKGKNIAPPYISIGIEAIEINRDRGNLLAMARSGLHAAPTVPNTADSFIQEGKFFPCRLRLQMSYIDSDVQRAIRMGTEIILMLVTKGFAFSVQYGDYHFEVSVSTDGSSSLQAPAKNSWVELEDEDRTNIQTFDIPLYVDTYAAILRRAAGVQRVVSTEYGPDNREML